jgi:uncharacterized alkaline shock family protein YloU
MTEVQIEQDQNRQLVSTAATGRMIDAVGVQGKTTIADGVIAKIVSLAAREVDGVHGLVGSGPGTTLSGLASRVTGTDQRAQGVLVEVGEREVAVDLRMVVLYGVNIPQLAEEVRRNISNRVSAISGLIVKEVNINVADLFFPEETPPPASRVQ